MKKNLLLVSGLIFFSACSYEYVVVKTKAEPIEVNTDNNANSSSEEIIAPFRRELGNSMNTVLCQSEMAMTKRRPESELGNLVADLCLEIGNELCQKNSIETIDFCLMNTGGLRASLPSGEITTGNVFELMPFENELVVVTLAPEGILELINYLKISGGEPISGIRILHNKDNFEASVNGESIDTEKKYRVLTTDYLANGGDKMTFFQEGNRASIEILGMKMRDAIHLYFQRQGETNKSIKGALDGRLQIKE